MGKRQRDTEFLNYSNERLEALARNANTPKPFRRRIVKELKDRSRRNVRTRRSKQRRSPKRRS